MINFVIKMTGETIEGHPIDITNFKHANNITDRISISLVEGMGYAPFHNNEKPFVTSRQKVEDNGYFKDNDGFVKHNYQVVDKTADELLAIIDALKNEKKVTIKAAYEKAANADVEHNSITWDGGFDTSMKLDAAKRLAETVGATDVIFYDANNVDHTLSIADAEAVIIAIANAFQTAMAQKQSLFTTIDAATTVAEVDSAVWV